MKNLFMAILVVLLSGLLTYAQSDIHKVDFKNFTYQIPNVTETFTVQDGQFSTDDQIFSVKRVDYGDVDGDSKDEAVVTTVYSFSKNFEGAFYNAEVFTIKNHKPVLMATIKGGGLEELPNIELNIKIENGIVIVDRHDDFRLVKMEKSAVLVDSKPSQETNDQALTAQYKWDGTGLKDIGSYKIHELHPALRILIPEGKTSATVKVKVKSDDTTNFIFSAKKGQILTVTTDAVKDYTRRSRTPQFVIFVNTDDNYQKFQKGIVAAITETRDYIIEFHNHFDRDLDFSATIKLK